MVWSFTLARVYVTMRLDATSGGRIPIIDNRWIHRWTSVASSPVESVSKSCLFSRFDRERHSRVRCLRHGEGVLKVTVFLTVTDVGLG